ncbi:MAG: transcription elongation factor GreA [Candidatus Omnitrophota bacterium]
MTGRYLTKEGFEQLQKELENLKQIKRRKIAEAIEKARALGDLKENAEYHAAKEAHSLNEAKIADLENTLANSRMIDETNIDKDKALLGAKIKIRIVNDNEIEEYTLVSEAEADFSQNKISVSSPLGQGVLGYKVGDVVQVKIPAGMITIEILEISR